jgi:hypothetical protein
MTIVAKLYKQVAGKAECPVVEDKSGGETQSCQSLTKKSFPSAEADLLIRLAMVGEGLSTWWICLCSRSVYLFRAASFFMSVSRRVNLFMQEKI